MMTRRYLYVVISLALAVSYAPLSISEDSKSPPDIGALSPIKFNPEKADLGRHLFFDTRLSGDDGIRCATCHNPAKGWADDLPLSKAYPGSEYFRNAKTILNSVYARYFYWDGRLTGRDAQTLVRDSITETHFMNMDGRLMFLRLQQVPEYVRMFEQVYGGEVNFNRVLDALAEFLKTIVSVNVPFDSGTLTSSAKAGMDLFKGKAGCFRCHNGAYFSDGETHNLGVPENPDIVSTPLRHITMRSMFKYMGVDNFENIRTDVGHYTVSKLSKDRGSFLTPTLRELQYTAPYMHNGMLATLDDVIDFYDRGGGANDGKTGMLRKLNLTNEEKQDLKTFLLALSGDPINMARPPRFEYRVIENWREVPN